MELHETKKSISEQAYSLTGIVAADDCTSRVRLISYTDLKEEFEPYARYDQPLDANKLYYLSPMGPIAGTINTDSGYKEQGAEIVWRSLAYEIKTSAQGRLVDNLSSLWAKFGEQTRRGQSTTVDFMASKQDLVAPVKYCKSTPRQTIFSNLNGRARFGELTAILGPSGAGKTSLLNAISSTANASSYRGSIELVGAEGRNMLLSVIPQKDYLIESLTVRENLTYASQLLNTEKKFDHETNVMRVVKMLNLLKCLDSRVGDVSGGEYKRVSIAQELLRQPDILVLDEPTSGLDSLTCERLIRSLKQLIDESKVAGKKTLSIIMTIHQPDIEVFYQFDRIYCMAARGGGVVYEGHPRDVMATIRSVTGLFVDKQDQQQQLEANPANLLIKLASQDMFGQTPIERLAEHQRCQFHLQDRNPEKIRTKSLETLVDFEQPVGDSTAIVRDKRLSSKHDHSGKFWQHTRLLTKRSFVALLRDSMLFKIMLTLHLSLPIGIWMIYPQSIGQAIACPVVMRNFTLATLTGPHLKRVTSRMLDDMMDVTECITMLFTITYALTICGLVMSALSFPLNMHLLLKELRNGWYNIEPFVLAIQAAKFPFEVVFPSLTMPMIYWLLDMPMGQYMWRMWAMMLVMSSVTMIASTQGLLVGALCMDSATTAAFLALCTTLPPNLLNGITVRYKNLPTAFKWASWTSHYRMASELTGHIRYGLGQCPCSDEMDQQLRMPPQFSGLPDVAKSTLNYYARSMNVQDDEGTGIIGESTPSFYNTTAETISMMMHNGDSDFSEQENEQDVLTQLANTTNEALAYGRRISSCKDYRSMALDMLNLGKEGEIFLTIGITLLLIFVVKASLFLVVNIKVRGRL